MLALQKLFMKKMGTPKYRVLQLYKHGWMYFFSWNLWPSKSRAKKIIGSYKKNNSVRFNMIAKHNKYYITCFWNKIDFGNQYFNLYIHSIYLSNNIHPEFRIVQCMCASSHQLWQWRFRDSAEQTERNS
jgi:hypothetical protein